MFFSTGVPDRPKGTTALFNGCSLFVVGQGRTDSLQVPAPAFQRHVRTPDVFAKSIFPPVAQEVDAVTMHQARGLGEKVAWEP